MKRYLSRIVIGCLCALLLVASTANKSESQLPVAVISAAAIGAVLLLGASMTPQQQSDFYGDLTGTIHDNCVATGEIARDAWQAIEVFNTLGQSYLAGRANRLKSSAQNFYNLLQQQYSNLSNELKNLFDENPPIEPQPFDPALDPPEPGEVGLCASGYKVMIGAPAGSPAIYGNLESCIYNSANLPGGVGCYPAIPPPRWLGGCVPAGDGWPPGYYKNQYYYVTVVTEEEPNYPPPTLPPDYCPLPAAIPAAAPPGSPLQQEIDNIISQAPPGTWTPEQTGDITTDEAGQPGILPEPLPVDIPGDTPDPTLDNSLLRGIYNNTLATARNTVKIKDKVIEVKDQIIALPGSIVPPIVGAIEALPAPIVGAIDALPGKLAPVITDPIVAKLDEVKNAIPPPITAIEVEGSTPSLPNNNDYDPSVTSPDELSLSSTILDFIQNGLPFTSMLNDNAINLSNPVSHYDFELYDHQFSFDLTPYEGHLRAFGAFLYIMTVITSFVLVVRK